eukprot:COSAG01_NODE_32814_length_575_cov_0.539916_2_plen_139_part_00
MTEIYLCHACSDHELRVETPGQVAACREAGKYVATPVSGPYSPHTKGNNRYTPGHGGRAVIDAWTEHVRSQPDMVIFTTWNDLGEHHYVGPYNLHRHINTENPQYSKYNAFPHMAYLQLSAYFIGASASRRPRQLTWP